MAEILLFHHAMGLTTGVHEFAGALRDFKHTVHTPDLFGRTFATTNYGLLYTAKGTASLLVPLANVLTAATGSWHAVFYVAAALNILAAVMALVVLKPMRQRFMARS